MVPVPDYVPPVATGPSWQGSEPDAWKAAGAAWDAAVPTRLVDWEEWEIVGVPDPAGGQDARKRRAASIER